MGNTHSASLIEHLSVLEDPRIDRAKRHSLTDALTIAICAIVGGADSWTDVEMFGNSKRQWFDSFLELPNGIPSHDTFGRVFSMLDAEQFQSRFIEWVKAVSEVCNGQTVAIDGKSVMRSHDRFIGKEAIRMVGGQQTGTRTGQGGRQVQRDNGHTRAATSAGCVRAHSGDRRYGMSEGGRQDDHRAGSGLRAGAQEQSETAL